MRRASRIVHSLLATAVATTIGLVAGTASAADQERSWTPPAPLTQNPNASVGAQAIAMGPGGLATAVWVDDGRTHAARRPVGGPWGTPRAIGPAGNVLAATLADGSSVMALITGRTVTMYRWADAGIIRGKRFERPALGGPPVRMVTNPRGDIMVIYNRTCQYFRATEARWRQCPYPAGIWLQPGGVDRRGYVYAIAIREGIGQSLATFRPGSGWSQQRFAGRELAVVATNARGDLAVVADTWDGARCNVSATFRSRDGSFEPWQHLSTYECELGIPGTSHAAAVDADGRVSLAWDEGRDYTDPPRSVHVADRDASGVWTAARKLLDDASIDTPSVSDLPAFAANPAGDIVLIAEGEVPDGEFATRSVTWAVTRPADGDYRKPVELPHLSRSEAAIDGDGDAAVVALDEFLNVAFAYEAP